MRRALASRRELRNVPSSSGFWKRWCKIDVNSLNVGGILQGKPAETEDFFFRSFLNFTNSVSSMVRCLFSRSISCWLSFGSLWYLRSRSISFKWSFMNVKMFKVSAYYLFDGCRIHSNIPGLISDTGYLCLLFFCQSCWKFIRFIDVFEEPASHLIFSVFFHLQFQWFLLLPLLFPSFCWLRFGLLFLRSENLGC